MVGEIYTHGELRRARERWKREGKVVVFTNGCYDILHPGHIRTLERCKELGHILILALNSDESVALIKGPKRPIVNENDRASLAAALEAVDAITFFDEETPRELISRILPDVLVKGSDWSHFVAGREEVEAVGGKVVLLPIEPGHSTTATVEEIVSRRKAE